MERETHVSDSSRCSIVVMSSGWKFLLLMSPRRLWLFSLAWPMTTAEESSRFVNAFMLRYCLVSSLLLCCKVVGLFMQVDDYPEA